MVHPLPGFFLVGVLPYGGGGVGIFGWVGFPILSPPPSPCRVGHCGGLWVSTKGAGQGILPVVRHFAYGSWLVGWDICESVGLPKIWVRGSPKSPPPPPPPPLWLRKTLTLSPLPPHP